ncbi:efflux RND transporter permease subunit [Shewanella sp. 202IG2-18]|uniref:efflux RND transporter permease subunit n=1 Tax=Parashewanella hymeniacidonis TaxID=2807618 RepID=UPI001960DB29|nr:CusA/CzcA family heavy metal efflux RND transporter [Parashewanella hymeniacidonis]MBM7072799.1 efflux RND transporter permease subunit [Parashewanella hymeniacidonis]
MIKRIISLALSQRLIVLLLSAMLGFWGVVELKRTPLDALPDLSDVQVIVKTSFAGQAPQLIEQQITYPLSNVLLAVPGAKAVRGYSFFGDSYIYVIFDDNTDLYWARSRVQETLSQSSYVLPAGVQPQIGPDASGVGWVFEYALVDGRGTQDLSDLTSLQNWYLKQGLQSVAGVAEVATIGGMEQSYQIVLNPSRLVDHKIDIDTVVQAVKQSNRNVGGSVIEMGEAEYMVRSPGYLTSIAHIEQIPLGSVSPSGRAILLKDVADVRKGPAARRGIAELNGEGEVVGGIVVMRYNQNALATIQAVKAKLEQLQIGLPDGVEVIPTYDRSQLIQSSVDNLLFKISEEMLVVAFVCLLFLFHARSTLVAIIVLPLSVLGAFIFMRQLGINANIMSLGGIAIAIGAVVDGAIVMVENFHKHREYFDTEFKRLPSTQEHWHLVLKSCTEVGPALFFSLLIITLSFVPVFALEAQEGRLFSPLAYTKTFAMAVAALLSITLIPVLIGFIIRGRIPKETSNPLSRFLIFLYKPIINKVLEFPKVTIGIALVIFASSWYPLSKSGTEFMPELDEGDLLYMPTTLPGISAAKAGQILQQTDRLISTLPEVKRVFGKVGRADTATDPAPLTMIETTIMLKPKDEWRADMTLDKLIDELQQTVNIPGLTNAWVQPIKTRIDMLSTGIKTPVGLKISGDDVATLEQLGQQVEQVLSQLKGTRSVYAERSSSGRYLDITPKLNIAARYGINQQQIHNVVRYAIGGMKVSDSIQGTERYPINVRYPRNIRDNIEKLKQLPIVTQQGHFLPLSQVADIKINRGAPMMKSENGRLISWVFVDLDDISIGEYIATAKSVLDSQINVPARYTYEFAGQYEYMQRVKDKLIMVIPATLVIIFILLVMTFGQTQQALIVMSSLPFALVGSAWLLFGLDMNYSTATAIGMIALTGVAAEFSVIMLLYLNNAIEDAKSQGKLNSLSDLKQAITHGAVMRIRPKAMTVATIFFGLLPVMWGAGSGNEVMKNIAAPMIGGMVTAPILSLLVLPAIYLIVHDKHLKA